MRGTQPRTRQARARIALALCITWLVGFEVMPWMHVALHDHLAPHHHTATGTISDDHDAEVDEHAGADEHHHDVDHDDVDHDGPLVVVHFDHHHHADHHDARARLASALAHGAHSLAHHGLAVPTPAPVVTSPLPVDRRPFAVAAVIACMPTCPDPLAASARGPPDVA